ncbi:hypothetical protein GGF44_006322, partial [Coemansia sp. RSA 1694]
AADRPRDHQLCRAVPPVQPGAVLLGGHCVRARVCHTPAAHGRAQPKGQAQDQQGAVRGARQAARRARARAGQRDVRRGAGHSVRQHHHGQVRVCADDDDSSHSAGCGSGAAASHQPGHRRARPGAGAVGLAPARVCARQRSQCGQRGQQVAAEPAGHPVKGAVLVLLSAPPAVCAGWARANEPRCWRQRPAAAADADHLAPQHGAWHGLAQQQQQRVGGQLRVRRAHGGGQQRAVDQHPADLAAGRRLCHGLLGAASRRGRGQGRGKGRRHPAGPHQLHHVLHAPHQLHHVLHAPQRRRAGGSARRATADYGAADYGAADYGAAVQELAARREHWGEPGAADAHPQQPR